VTPNMALQRTQKAALLSFSLEVTMPEKPLAGILNREEAAKHAQEHFGDQIALLRDLADYGSNLVFRAFNASAKDLPPIIACGVLLKQVVAMLDAVYTLVATGMVHAAFLPARAAFEASMYLDWLLFSDTERKATAYIVSNFRDERLWVARVTKGTSEEAIFDAISKSVGLDIHARRPTLAADAQKHLAEVNRILAQKAFAAMDKEYDQAKGKKQKYDPEWYQLCGAKSIRQVAQQVGRLPEYEFFYSKGSQITHTASYKDHIRFTKGQVHFTPIRHLQGIDHLLNFVVGIAVRSFQNTLSYYRPGELSAFSKKYLEDWRKPFMTVKKVKYNFE
jgi:hypothetical protein